MWCHSKNAWLYSRTWKTTATSGNLTATETNHDQLISLTISFSLKSAFIQWFNPNKVTTSAVEYSEQTFLMSSPIWHEHIIGLKCVLCVQLMFCEVKNILRLYIETGSRWHLLAPTDVLWVVLPVMSAAVTWHWLCMGPWGMYRARKTSIKDTLITCVQQKSLKPVLKILFRAVISSAF